MTLRHRRRLLLAVACVAVLGALAWVFQPVRVVGRSMEPSLAEGDWLFVAREDPTPTDLVVFREPGSGKLAVKRVAGTPGQRVLLREGALLIDGAPAGPPPAGVEQLVPVAQASGRAVVDLLDVVSSGFEAHEDAWLLADGKEGVAYLHRPPREDYLMRGERVQGRLPAADLGIEIAFRLLTDDARLDVVLRKGRAAFIASLDHGGRRARILREESGGPAEEVFAVDLDAPHVRGVLFFTLAQRGMSLTLDGLPLASGIPYAPPPPVSLADVPAEFGRLEHAGAGGRGPLEVLGVRLGRGVLYEGSGTYGVGEAFQLADDEYFLLGDNPARSRDSRHYGAVARDRILGVVAWRVWPGGWTERGWPVD
jgi:signal peptidase I